MSRKTIKKSLNRSFRNSARYSAALVFGVLFLVSSMYGLPNFSATKVNNSGDTKNLKTTNTVKLDSSYRKYCDSDDHNGLCKYVAINDDSLLDTFFPTKSFEFYSEGGYDTNIDYILSIRAPPVKFQV